MRPNWRSCLELWWSSTGRQGGKPTNTSTATTNTTTPTPWRRHSHWIHPRSTRHTLPPPPPHSHPGDDTPVSYTPAPCSSQHSPTNTTTITTTPRGQHSCGTPPRPVRPTTTSGPGDTTPGRHHHPNHTHRHLIYTDGSSEDQPTVGRTGGFGVYFGDSRDTAQPTTQVSSGQHCTRSNTETGPNRHWYAETRCWWYKESHRKYKNGGAMTGRAPQG